MKRRDRSAPLRRVGGERCQEDGGVGEHAAAREAQRLERALARRSVTAPHASVTTIGTYPRS